MLSDSTHAPTGSSAVGPEEYAPVPGPGRTLISQWVPPEPIHPPAEPSGPPGYPLAWQPLPRKTPEPSQILYRTARGGPTDSGTFVHCKVTIADRDVDYAPSSNSSFERGPAPRVPNPNCYPPAPASSRTEDSSSREDDPLPSIGDPHHASQIPTATRGQRQNSLNVSK
ncbi:hypothetical protein CGMCC3_g17208 [Colletotrichum fructicola]|nr:uncharacterized protein CGMCC3_g17208 [Colletotrichum fructicola]KAE9566633.1 hypothetical protein CGMCC3_g17208 [Colletotrichum fructicola]